MLDIADVAKKSGVPASTLRYYEEKGLIRCTGRNGLRRLFDTKVMERLALIALGRSAGFSLDEIQQMIGSEGKPQIDRKMLQNKAGELDRSIKKLIAMRDGLHHAAVCSAASHMECPTFLRLLGLASARVNDKAAKKRVTPTRV